MEEEEEKILPCTKCGVDRKTYKDVLNNQKVRKCTVCHRVLEHGGMLQVRARGLHSGECRGNASKLFGSESDIVSSHSETRGRPRKKSTQGQGKGKGSQ